MITRILLADDHATVRSALRTLVTQRQDWQVCAEAADGLDAVEKAKSLVPDVVVLDLAMGKLNGVEAAEEICAICPNTLVLVTSLHDARPLLERLHSIGVRGFISKTRLATDLLPALEAVLKGRSWFPTAGAR
jgi:two-component system, NarL family, response regulator NreC